MTEATHDETAQELFERFDATMLAGVGSRPGAGEPYGRALLLDAPDAELLLMRWARGLPCAPHDHGEATGSIRVLRGELTETVFRVESDGLVATRENTLRAGDTLALGEGHVHQMCAQDDAVTLHLYHPKIHRMRVWDLPHQRLLIVDDAQGAFVPEDATRILAASPWPVERGTPGSRDA